MKDLCRNPAGVSLAGFTANKTSQLPHVWNTNVPAAFAARRWSSVAAAAAAAIANKERVRERDSACMQIKGRRVANEQVNEKAIKTDGQFFLIVSPPKKKRKISTQSDQSNVTLEQSE